jgi:hypothetical protein
MIFIQTLRQFCNNEINIGTRKINAKLQLLSYLGCLIYILNNVYYAQADTIVFVNNEQYSGRAIFADPHKIVFDLQCEGNIVEIEWNHRPVVWHLGLNDSCKPEPRFGTGGDMEADCKSFTVHESLTETAICIPTFTYKDGRLSLSIGGSYDLNSHSITDINGRTQRMPKKFMLTIQHVDLARVK